MQELPLIAMDSEENIWEEGFQLKRKIEDKKKKVQKDAEVAMGYKKWNLHRKRKT